MKSKYTLDPSYSRIFFIALLLLTNSAFSQVYTTWENGAYGLINKEGKELIAPFVISAEETKEKIMICYDKQKKNLGLLSQENKIILPFIYDEIKRMERGFSLKKDEKYGYANREGKIVLPVTNKYKIEEMAPNVLLVCPDSLFGVTDSLGNKLIGYEYEALYATYDHYMAVKNQKHGLLGKNGQVILPFIYDDISYPNSPFLYVVKQNEKAGIVDTTGKIIIPIRYKYIYHEVNPLNDHAYYKTQDKEMEGFYKPGMTIFTEPQFESFKFTRDDFVIVTKLKKENLIDPTGKILLQGFDAITPTDISGLYITKRNGLSGLRDVKGKALIPEIYKEINEIPGQDLFSATQNKTLIYFSKDGKRTVLPYYDNDSLAKKYEDYALLTYKVTGLKKANRWGAVNIYSKKTIIPFIYDSIFSRESETYVIPGQPEAQPGDYDYMERQYKTFSFYNTIAHPSYVIKNGKTGVFDENGKQLIPFDHDEVNIFFKGRALARKGNKYGYINTANQVLIPFEFDTIQAPWVFSGDTLIINNFLKAKKNGKYGMIDSSGKTLIDFLFDEISDFGKEEYAFVKTGNKTGVINRSGNYLIEPQELPIDKYIEGLGVLSLDKDPIIYVNSKGEEVWHSQAKEYSRAASFYGNVLPANIGYLKEMRSFRYTYGDPDVLGMSAPLELPKSFYKMERLERLDLDFLVPCISPEIKELKNLHFLAVSFIISCSNIPRELGNLTKLDSLTIESYFLGDGVPSPECLPEEVTTIPSLRYLKSGFPVRKLSAGLKYIDLYTDSLSSKVVEPILKCSELEKININYSIESDSLITYFLRKIAALNKLSELNLNSNNGNVISLTGRNNMIDTLRISSYPIYELPRELTEKKIVYAATQSDTVYFPNLEHLNYISQPAYNLPRGLANCRELRKLNLCLRDLTDWEIFMAGLEILPVLETLRLSIYSDYRNPPESMLGTTFYDAVNKLASKGKLKNLMLNMALTDETVIADMKQRLPGINVSIVNPHLISSQ